MDAKVDNVVDLVEGTIEEDTTTADFQWIHIGG